MTTQDKTRYDNTTQHSTAQHNTTQHSIWPYKARQDTTRQHKTRQHNSTQHNIWPTQGKTRYGKTTQDKTAQLNTTQHTTTHHTTRARCVYACVQQKTCLDCPMQPNWTMKSKNVLGYGSSRSVKCHPLTVMIRIRVRFKHQVDDNS